MGKAAEERRLRVPLRYTAHDQHLVAQTPGLPPCLLESYGRQAEGFGPAFRSVRAGRPQGGFGVYGSYARVGDSDIDRVGVGLALPWSGDGKPSPYRVCVKTSFRLSFRSRSCGRGISL